MSRWSSPSPTAAFPDKAVAAWHALDDRGHLALVRQYLLAANGWQAIELLDRSPAPGRSDPLFAVVAQAVIPPKTAA